MDFLGLRQPGDHRRALENIRRRHGVEVDIDNVALDDPKSHEMRDSATRSVSFQLGRATRCAQLMRRLAPTGFRMTSRPSTALYRPGPLSENVAHYDFADRKNGRSAVSYDPVSSHRAKCSVPFKNAGFILRPSTAIILLRCQVTTSTSIHLHNSGRFEKDF